MSYRIHWFSHAFAAAAMTAAASGPALAQPGDGLPEPVAVVIDRSLSATQRESMVLAARRYYAFWNTGDERYARLALTDNFVDRSLPAGRPQGPAGPLFAAKNFRAAVPDLQAEVEEMLLVGDRVIGRLRFTGHYTGQSQGTQGDGRRVDFIAIDIYRIADGRIVENWHLEDNLTLLKQLGVVAQ